jgi:hypothetical protein
MARTFWTFGFQRRFVRRCEWLSCMPKRGCLPQIWHTDAMESLFRESSRNVIKNTDAPTRVGPSE